MRQYQNLILTLIIENSFYESFDEDLDALEYLWVEDTYPNLN